MPGRSSLCRWFFQKILVKGTRNVGLYRMQVFDARTTGMHWHLHKVGARHFSIRRKSDGKMELAVCLGGDPAMIYAATAPLPRQIDEILFAGFLAQERSRAGQRRNRRCRSARRYRISSSKGTSIPRSRFGAKGRLATIPAFIRWRMTIPCFTSPASPIEKIRFIRRPSSAVRRWKTSTSAKTTERLFLPLLRVTLPEIVDMNLPIHGVFHNLAIVSIKKEYPAHARKVMHALWGLGQMMFTKTLIVVDHDVNVQDLAEVTWVVGNHIDPKRDMILLEGPVECLDHAAPCLGFGSKVGIDATRKWRSEGFEREWPDAIIMDEKTKRYIDTIWHKLGI